jgi:hypothetical protein
MEAQVLLNNAAHKKNVDGTSELAFQQKWLYLFLFHLCVRHRKCFIEVPRDERMLEWVVSGVAKRYVALAQTTDQVLCLEWHLGWKRNVRVVFKFVFKHVSRVTITIEWMITSDELKHNDSSSPRVGFLNSYKYKCLPWRMRNFCLLAQAGRIGSCRILQSLGCCPLCTRWQARSQSAWPCSGFRSSQSIRYLALCPDEWHSRCRASM